MTATAKVSVVIPIKGRPQLFELTAQSLVDQTYVSWEAVMVDDGSSADEFKRIAEIAGRDERIILYEKAWSAAWGVRVPQCRTGRHSRGVRCVFGWRRCAGTNLPAAPGREVMKSNPKVDFAVFSTAVFRAIPGDTPLFWNQFTSDQKMISTDFFVSTCRGIRPVEFGEQPASLETVRGMIALSPRKIASFTFVRSRQVQM